MITIPTTSMFTTTVKSLICHATCMIVPHIRHLCLRMDSVPSLPSPTRSRRTASGYAAEATYPDAVRPE